MALTEQRSIYRQYAEFNLPERNQFHRTTSCVFRHGPNFAEVILMPLQKGSLFLRYMGLRVVRMEVVVCMTLSFEFLEFKTPSIPIDVVIPRHNEQSVPIKSSGLEKFVEELGCDRVLVCSARVSDITRYEDYIRITPFLLSEAPYRPDESAKYNIAIVRIAGSNV